MIWKFGVLFIVFYFILFLLFYFSRTSPYQVLSCRSWPTFVGYLTMTINFGLVGWLLLMFFVHAAWDDRRAIPRQIIPCLYVIRVSNSQNVSASLAGACGRMLLWLQSGMPGEGQRHLDELDISGSQVTLASALGAWGHRV